MIVRFSIDVDDLDRRALAYRYGKRGLATRADFRAFVDSLVSTTLDDVRNEYERSESDDLDEGRLSNVPS